MAADSNPGFHQEEALGSAVNRHGISFQSGAVNSSSEMIGMGNYYAMNNGGGSLVFSGNSSMVGNSSPSVTQVGNSSASVLLDSVNGLKHDTGLAVEWSTEEQYKLEEGLIKYADEPSILRYIKIASTLREKTVRDVALRCRWMMRKRRKQEESSLGRKGSYRKEKLPEPPSKTNISSTHAAAHPLSMHRMDNNERIKCEVMRRSARQLLEQNIQFFSEINQNLSSMKLQDNVALFCHTRENINNLSAIMKGMPGRMSQMQELPVSIDQDLADSILPSTTHVELQKVGISQGLSSSSLEPGVSSATTSLSFETRMMMLNMSSRVQPKQELRYSGAISGVNV